MINDYRTSLAQQRAESLIMSAARFKMQMSSKYLPKLPIDGVEDDLDSIIELDEALAGDSENLLGAESDGDCSEDDFDNPFSEITENEA